METPEIKKTSNEIYELLGEGYGFNGSKEDAIKLLDEKITDIIKHYSDKAFCAGRSKQSWKIFYAQNFNSHPEQLKEKTKEDE